jgi:hypothetical protein
MNPLLKPLAYISMLRTADEHKSVQYKTHTLFTKAKALLWLQNATGNLNKHYINLKLMVLFGCFYRIIFNTREQKD